MFFIQLPEAVEESFKNRGLSLNEILYTAKADVSKQNSYQDIYLALTKTELHVLYGLERFRRVKRGQNEITYETTDYRTYPLDKIKSIKIDRLYTVSSFIVELESESVTVCRLSVSSIGVFEKLGDRIGKLQTGEAIDDSGLKNEHKICPLCKRPYPNQERAICPGCLSNTTSFKRLMKEYFQYRKEAVTIFLLLIISTLITLLSPLVSARMLYDRVLTVGADLYGQVLLVVLLLLGIKVITTIFSSIYGIIISKISCKMLHNLRLKIFSSMQRLSVNFFISKATGTLMTRIDDDSDWLYFFFVDLVPYYMVSLVTVVGLVVVMGTMSFTLTALIFTALVLVGVMLGAITKTQKRLHRRQHRSVRSLKATITDSLGGQKVVKSFAGESQEVARFGKKSSAYFGTRLAIGYFNASRFPMMQSIYQISQIAIFGIGAYLVITDHLLLGQLISMIFFADMAMNCMEYFINSSTPITRAMDSATRMFEILDTEPSVREKDNPVRMPKMRGDITVQNVGFEYVVGRPVIKNLSFEVKSGQMIGLVGKTGAGKSTIINLIARLYDPTEGEILIDGVNIREIAFEDLRKNIGVVTQETYLFMGTITENIRYARPDATTEEVIAAAKAAYAHDFIVRFPEGYDTMVGNGGTQLSGGEKQRISIARAILQDPAVLILDEATAAMDTQTERHIQEAIEELRQGKTIISIAHRLSTLRDADSLAVIDKGDIVEMGTHRELILQKGVYFTLHQIQLESLKFIQD